MAQPQSDIETARPADAGARRTELRALVALRDARKHAAAAAPKLIRTAIGAAILIVAGRWALLSFVLSVSTHAVVGARLTRVNAPISGVLAGSMDAPEILAPGSVLGTITNRWADDGFVRELENRAEILDAELQALPPRIASLEDFGRGLRQGSRSYQAQRVKQLGSLLAENEARLQSERISARAARDRFERFESLAGAGVVSAAERDDAERALEQSEQRVLGAQDGVASLKTQLESARAGVQLDASGTGPDRPYSRQRLDEVELELLRLRHELETKTRLKTTLQGELARARSRYRELSLAELVAPRRARIWERTVAHHAVVSAGDQVLALIDCESILVVAAVSERVFNRLSVGDAAKFEPKRGDREYDGRVIQLIGPVGYANHGLLIAPGLIADDGRDPRQRGHRVVVAVPELARAAEFECSVGRSGHVRFFPER